MKTLQKFLPFLFSFVLLFSVSLLAGCKRGGEETPPTPPQSPPSSAPPQQPSSGVEKTSSLEEMFQRIAQGEGVQCAYSIVDDTGKKNGTAKSWLKGGKHRLEVTTEDGTVVYNVSDGKTFYTWDSKRKQGTKMTRECLESFASQYQQEGQQQEEAPPSVPSDPQEAMRNAPDIQCAPFDGEVDLSLPEDVHFVDQCALLQKQQDLLQQFQKMGEEGSIMNP